MADYPVVISGLARSGTSLLRSILGTHPDIAFYENDLEFWPLIYVNHMHLWGRLHPKQLAKQIIRAIYAHYKIPDTDVIPNRNRVSQRVFNSNLNGFANYIQFAGSIFKIYIDEYRIIKKKPRWGFKTPDNEFFKEEITEAYPGARFIHIIRDPYQNLASRKKNNYYPDCDEISDLDLLKTVTKHNRSIEIFAKYTIERPGDFFGFGYINFIKDPKTYLKIICSLIDLTYNPDILKMDGHHKNWKGNNSSWESKEKGVSLSLATKPITNLTKKEKGLISSFIRAGEEARKERYPLFWPLSRLEAINLCWAGSFIANKGDNLTAELAFTKAIEIDKSYDEAYLQRAMMFHKKKESIKSLAMAISGLKSNPLNRKAILLCSELLKQKGKIQTLSPLIHKYVDSFSDDVEVSAILSAPREAIK